MHAPELQYQQLVDIGLSDTTDSLMRRLTATAEAMGFPLISGMLMRGSLGEQNRERVIFGNIPDGYLEASMDPLDSLRDPVLTHLTSRTVPVTYGQPFYIAAGAGDLWEHQACFGYKAGVAVRMHLSDNRDFVIGVDRDEPLPQPGQTLTRLIASFQLFAVHASTAAERLLIPTARSADFPRLTGRERDVLASTHKGNTAWEVSVALGMSETTVNFHLRNAMKKLGVKSKHQAVLRCISAGLF